MFGDFGMELSQLPKIQRITFRLCVFVRVQNEHMKLKFSNILLNTSFFQKLLKIFTFKKMRNVNSIKMRLRVQIKTSDFID